MSTQQTIAAISGALGLINAEIPVALAAYQALHALWTAAHPGKTEAEFVAELRATATEGLDFSGRWLREHGYAQQPDGTWRPAR